MSSYLSNLLTHTTSRYASLRRTLLSTEDDGDTPDDTHICRVLRAYYTEKNRAFPDWLPPDPNKKVAQQQQQPAGGYAGMNQNSTWGRGQVGALRGEGREPVQRASLSDLWDAPAGGQGGTTAPQSLRAARRPMQNPAANASVGGLAPPPVQGRPLPSQRAGSYQSVASQSSINLGGYGAGNRPGSGTSFESGSGGGTAQERLKARLWGAARVAGAGGGVGGGNEQQDDGSGRRYGR